MKEPERKERTYTLENQFLSVAVSDFGAAIQSIRFAGREVSLGFSDSRERVASGTYSGATIGRVANRIAGGKFSLNGKTYNLTKNEGETTLHGGKVGFDSRFFDAEYKDGKIRMTLVSEDGDQGFPGKLKMRAEFSLDKASLVARFFAESDADTVWAPTLHTYFRLGDERTIEKTILQIFADGYTPVDGALIPTGEILPVAGTPFDFTCGKEIGKDIDDKRLAETGGYDHNFALRSEHALRAIGEGSGIGLDIYSDMPGLQFYSGNVLKGFTGKEQLYSRAGFALEPQFFPNAVNTPNFKSPILKKGELKTHYIRYDFFRR